MSKVKSMVMKVWGNAQQRLEPGPASSGHNHLQYEKEAQLEGKESSEQGGQREV